MLKSLGRAWGGCLWESQATAKPRDLTRILLRCGGLEVAWGSETRSPRSGRGPSNLSQVFFVKFEGPRLGLGERLGEPKAMSKLRYSTRAVGRYRGLEVIVRVL